MFQFKKKNMWSSDTVLSIPQLSHEGGFNWTTNSSQHILIPSTNK